MNMEILVKVISEKLALINDKKIVEDNDIKKSLMEELALALSNRYNEIGVMEHLISYLKKLNIYKDEGKIEREVYDKLYIDYDTITQIFP